MLFYLNCLSVALLLMTRNEDLHTIVGPHTPLTRPYREKFVPTEGLLTINCTESKVVFFIITYSPKFYKLLIGILLYPRVPVVSRNWHDLVFRLAEIGVALWFPCVLWNCMAPERLWLLNPRRLLARQLDDARLADLLAHKRRSDTKVVSYLRTCLHVRYGPLITSCLLATF